MVCSFDEEKNMMDREIKFRAWDKEEMIYFDPTTFNWSVATDQFWEDRLPIMQFTGLQDKNGKDIYEGDIVSHYGGYDFLYSEVFYSDGYWYPLVQVEDGHNCIDKYYPEEWEVVGNIYENEELL